MESNMASIKEGGAGQGRTEPKGGQGRGDCEGPAMEMYEELRQRELRKKKCDLPRHPGTVENSTYREKTDWDRASIESILRELKMEWFLVQFSLINS
jgi:hypothetical protein